MLLFNPKAFIIIDFSYLLLIALLLLSIFILPNEIIIAKYLFIIQLILTQSTILIPVL